MRDTKTNPPARPLGQWSNSNLLKMYLSRMRPQKYAYK